jgi:hypothetical protein
MSNKISTSQMRWMKMEEDGKEFLVVITFNVIAIA